MLSLRPDQGFQPNLTEGVKYFCEDPAADLGLGSVLAATQLKLLAGLPAEFARKGRPHPRRFYLDAPGWLRETGAIGQTARAMAARHSGGAD